MSDEEKEIEEGGRLSELEEIAQRAAQDREGEFEPVDVDLEEDAPEVDEDAEPEQEEQEEPAEEEPEEKMIEVVVDGETQKVPLSKVLDAGKRTFQKETAADKRLEEATKLLKGVETRQPPEEGVDEEPSELELAQARIKKARSDYAKAQTSVDDEEIERALEEYENAQRHLLRVENSTFKDEVIKEASDRFSMKSLNERLRMPVEEGGQADIMADERALAIAGIEINRLVKEEGADPKAWSTYQKAGKATREYLGWGKKEPDGFEKKREKKEKIVDIKPAAQKTPSSVTKEKPKTREQFIREGVEDLKKARGQTD